MHNQKGYTLTELIITILFIAGVIGWVMNIIEIVQTISDPITGMFILRCVGIIAAPLGAVLGYL